MNFRVICIGFRIPECIGVILGGTGVQTPTFWSGRTDPQPLHKYTKSKALLGPPHFSDQSFGWLLPCSNTCHVGATENAGVENAIRSKLQGRKMREWK